MAKEELKKIRGKTVLLFILPIIFVVGATVTALFGIRNTLLEFSLLIGSTIYAIFIIITCLKD